MSKKLQEILDSRQEDYGDSLPAFTRIGRGIGAILDFRDVTPVEVSLIMDFIKTIRITNAPKHLDSWLDKQGYVKHGQEIAMKGSE